MGEPEPAKPLLDEVARRLPAGRRSLLAARLALERAFLQLNEDAPQAAVASAATGVDLVAKLLGKEHPEYFEAVLLLSQARIHSDQCVQALPDIDDVMRQLARPPGKQRPIATAFRGLRARCLRKLNRLDEASAEFKNNDAAAMQLFGARLAGLCG